MKKIWEKLFSKNNIQEKKSDPQNPPIHLSLHDDLHGRDIEITLVCTCSYPVELIETDEVEDYEDWYFYCEHCDRPCVSKNCDLCREYEKMVNTRLML